MSKKQMLWKTKGMNRDLSVSAFNPEFALENMNLRLSTNDGNTLMSWVNEKGTKKMTVTIEGSNSLLAIVGIPVGTAVLNHYLVIFTTTNSDKNGSGIDRIYRLKYKPSKTIMEGIMLYEGSLNLCTASPLETLVSYEAGHIQKVYWTDGRNQPRMINIVADSSVMAKWEGDNTCFDFVTTFESPTDVTVTKELASGGVFAPGVIQYCISYVNMYGQQSNMVWVSPLYYLSFSDRGANPEEKVGGSFTIKISNADQRFDYVRLYAVQRTSLDAVPFVRHIEDLAITQANEGYVSYTDNGTTGSSVDPTELLYIGGTSITALTMSQKDNTLFLGNISQSKDNIDAIQSMFYNAQVDFVCDDTEKTLPVDPVKTLYNHTFTLNKSSREITTFKGGEWYRFGFQLQKKTGEWSDPILLGDTRNDKYPVYSNGNTVQLPYATFDLDFSSNPDLVSDYVKARPVVVYPSISDREVICQGVLNPTVFNVVDRKTSSPFAQASWYFRPYIQSNDEIVSDETIEGSGYESWESLAEANASVEYYGIPESEPERDEDFVPYETKSCYVLLCDFDASKTDSIDAVLKSGKLAYKAADYSGDTMYHPFDIGAIMDKTAQGNIARFFFFSTREWPFPVNSGVDSTTYHYVDTDIIENSVVAGVGTAQPNQPIYKDIKSSPEKHWLYYNKETTVNKKQYSYYFLSGAGWYEIIFTGLTAQNSDAINESTAGGVNIRYKHYDSIYSQDIIDEDVESKKNYVNAAKQVEVQGSKNIIGGVFGTTLPDHPTSNTQFMIDQSIVTLNSPDLEFDTNVQNYDMSNVKLRIVGIIPITSSLSSHSITTETPMLPTYYNTSSTPKEYGTGEIPSEVSYIGSTSAGKRLVADYLWNDSYMRRYDGDKLITVEKLMDFLVFPWQHTGSLNSDNRSKDEASSWLGTKKESTNLYSFNSIYRTNENILNDNTLYNVKAGIHLTENNNIGVLRLGSQSVSLNNIDYYPNIDKILYNYNGYKAYIADEKWMENLWEDSNDLKSAVSMRYNSTTHAVLALCGDSYSTLIPILPSFGNNNIGAYSGDGGTPYWADSSMGVSVSFSQANIDDITCNYNFLWLGELYREVNSSTIFGGQSKEALLANKWVIGGKEVPLEDGIAPLVWTDGDTYYQRYDCLKTYARSNEDPNQLVEILSFMCESRVNLDGRYDRNRARHDSYVLRPEVFNMMNPIYSQLNNFFPIRKVWKDKKDDLSYPNLLWYSKTKTSGADVDLWTNVVLSSVLELDGDKGEIEKLIRFNDQLLCFQDSGLSRISYNENTMIANDSGVPIEIANSNKVSGSNYISDTVGCSNKWSVVGSPNGVYFMDSNERSIYLYNGQLQNLSVSMGFNSWCKQNIPGGKLKWKPDVFEGFKSSYDKLNQEVLFVNKDIALAFSERMGVFSSFYDYGRVPYFEGLDDTGLWLRYVSANNGDTDSSQYCELWQHQTGDYCSFFGEVKPYWVTLVGNPEPLTDKIFTNLEFRACVDGEGSYVSTNADTEKYVPYLPFDTLETWNEYQRGLANLSWRDGHYPYRHHLSDNSAHLARKFRIWRCDIPRDNGKSASVFDSTFNDTFHVPERTGHRNDRMRNPWLYLKLTGHVPEEGSGGGTPIYKKDIVRFNTPHTLSASEIEEIRNWRSTGYELGFYVHSSLVRGVPSAETLKICVEGMLNGQLDVDEEYHYMEDSEGDYFLHDDGESDVFDTDHTFTVKARKLADSSEATVTVDICIHDYGNPMDIDTPHSSSDKRVEIHDVVMTYYN